MSPDTQVVLGQVAFRDFEVPEHIPFGGKHIINRHTLIGGDRVLDKLGYSPDDIRWSGRFRGNDALLRAKAVEAMARSGEEVTLSWGALTFQVVVEDFDPNYEKRYEIPYRVRVVVSNVQSQSQSGSSAGAAISSDMEFLTSIANDLPGGGL